MGLISLHIICIQKSTLTGASKLTGNALSSQSVSRQVLSAYECLTTVFGMGTGGTTQLSSPDIQLNVMHIQNYTEEKQRSAALAALSRFAVLRSKTASLKCRTF